MRTLLIAAIAFGSSAIGSPASAQQARTTDGRGLAWVGCWQSADGIQAQGRVCVLPAGDRDLRIITLDADDKSTESTLHLDGVKRDVDADGCTGWELARLASDGDRIIVDAQIRCGDSPPQMRTTAFLITPAGYWLQVNGAGISTVANAQVRLFRAVESYAALPASIRAAVAPVAAEAEQARMRTMERAVSASDLVELDEMGVATRVIDLVVAASYPTSFVIDAQGAMSAAANMSGGGSENRSYASFPFYYQNGFPMLSFYDLAMLDNCARFGLYSCAGMGYASFGYNRYGYGYGAGLGSWGGYWPGYGGYGYGGIPVVVRPVTPAPNDPSGGNGRGRAVRGQGYSSGSSETGTRVAAPRSGGNTTGNSSAGSASSSAGGSGGSAGSASSGGSAASSGARTAKPRSP